VKSLDTNVLARFFIDDPDDSEAVRQRPAAAAALAERAMVTITVLLELEWVMRGFYRLPRPDVARVFRALLSIGHIMVEDRVAVLDALDLFDSGMDFADALHLAGSGHCEALCSFDDRSFARRARQLGSAVPVVVPTTRMQAGG
jgi:predicted nucleic-acid-binding protein